MTPITRGSKPSALQRFFKSGREDSPFKRLLIHGTLWAACFMAVYPLLRILGVALRPGDRLMSADLAIIPPDASIQSFLTVILDKPFLQWLWNSLVITVATSLIGVMLAATSAYAFSRFRFPGRMAGMVFLLTTQMIPATMVMVPLYILAIKLDLAGTFSGLVFAYSVTAVPFSIWILKGYYDTIPIDLEEAAGIDGCSRMEAFWRILLPLSTPALSIVFLYNFTAAWNDFLLARIILGSSEGLWTWPLGLESFMLQFQTAWGQFSAASIMVSIPVMILFLSTSRYLISGLTLGSVKG
jgi:arabinogalactan oligomer / maltooligosaccharide transport system permease protein